MSEIVRCARAGCGRRLTSAKSRAAGVGPVCAKKLAAKQAATTARFTRDQVRRALGLISQGRVEPVRGTREFRVTGSGGQYTTSAVGCTCPAAKNRLDCYHVAAASLLTA